MGAHKNRLNTHWTFGIYETLADNCVVYFCTQHKLVFVIVGAGRVYCDSEADLLLKNVLIFRSWSHQVRSSIFVDLGLVYWIDVVLYLFLVIVINQNPYVFIPPKPTAPFPLLDSVLTSSNVPCLILPAQQLAQLRNLKEEKISQKEFHETQIKELEEAVRRHKENLKNCK